MSFSKPVAEAGAFLCAGRNAPPGHRVANTVERVLFSQASFFHSILQIDMNPHTRSWGLEVTQCQKAPALIHDSFLFSFWRVCATLFRQERQRCLRYTEIPLGSSTGGSSVLPPTAH